MAVAVSDIEVSCAVNSDTRRDVQSRRHNRARSGSVNLDDKAIFTTDIDGTCRIYRHAIGPKNTGNGSDDSVGPNFANAMVLGIRNVEVSRFVHSAVPRVAVKV